MSSMTPEGAEERRQLEEHDREDEKRLLDFCLTEDEYIETWQGNPPAAVISRRDRYYGRKQ